MSCHGFRLPDQLNIGLACAQFDNDPETKIVERALADLFTTYPDNTNEAHVLLKVVALNDMYSTQLPMRAPDRPNVFDVARVIVDLNVDQAFEDQSVRIVSSISTTEIPGKRRIGRFSFATKYASWHRPEAYPMWDRRVQNYFTCLKRHHRTDWDSFSQGFILSADWGYADFHALVVRFREYYGLSNVRFKDLDKFLWIKGELEVPLESVQNIMTSHSN